MTTYAIGDHVQRNSAMVPVNQIAQWHREYPGGRRGIVIGIDTQFDARPYMVKWDDDAEPGYYRADDLLPAAVPEAQASLFGEGA
jgi:hypothetical protein